MQLLNLIVTMVLLPLQSKHRSACAIQLMEHLLAHADLKDEEMKVLVSDVWKTVKKSEGSSKIVVRMKYIFLSYSSVYKYRN